MGKKNRKPSNNEKQTQNLQDDNNSEENVKLNLQDDNNSEEEIQVNLQDNNNEDFKKENEFLKQENSRLEDELQTLKKELEEQRLRIEGLTKLELLLKIKENLKNKNVDIVNEKNKLEEVNKLGENSTEKIVVESKVDESKVESKKQQHKRLNPFFRRFF